MTLPNTHHALGTEAPSPAPASPLPSAWELYIEALETCIADIGSGVIAAWSAERAISAAFDEGSVIALQQTCEALAAKAEELLSRARSLKAMAADFRRRHPHSGARS